MARRKRRAFTPEYQAELVRLIQVGDRTLHEVANALGLTETEKAHYPVADLCAALEVSRSGYYAWQGRAAPARTKADEQLSVAIAAVHQRSRRTYGSPRPCRAAREGPSRRQEAGRG